MTHRSARFIHSALRLGVLALAACTARPPTPPSNPQDMAALEPYLKGWVDVHSYQLLQLTSVAFPPGSDRLQVEFMPMSGLASSCEESDGQCFLAGYDSTMSALSARHSNVHFEASFARTIWDLEKSLPADQRPASISGKIQFSDCVALQIEFADSATNIRTLGNRCKDPGAPPELLTHSHNVPFEQVTAERLMQSVQSAVASFCTGRPGLNCSLVTRFADTAWSFTLERARDGLPLIVPNSHIEDLAVIVYASPVNLECSEKVWQLQAYVAGKYSLRNGAARSSDWKLIQYAPNRDASLPRLIINEVMRAIDGARL